MRLDAGVDIGEGADRARDRAGRYLGPGLDQLPLQFNELVNGP
jgi:hypothetical protein